MNKSQDERQTIERLYELLGWKGYAELQWGPDPYNQCRQVMFGCPPGSWPKNKQVFPPARQDGNGMLWLMKQMVLMGYDVEVSLSPQHGGEVVIDHERYGLRVIVDEGPDIPRKANKAAIEALEQRNV